MISCAKAVEVLNNAWDGALPVHIMPMVEHYRGVVYRVPEQEELALYTTTHDGFEVQVRADEPLLRHRFVVAHCLGRYMHHAPDAALSVSDFSTESSDTHNQKANFFARSLLVPKGAIELVLKYIDDKNNNLIERVANQLRVSEVCLNMRIKELQCF